MKLVIRIRGGGGEQPQIGLLLLRLLSCFLLLSNSNAIQIDNRGKNSGEISINKGMSHGCSLSPILVRFYIGDLLRTWKTVTNPGIQKNNTFLRTPSFC